MAAGAARRRRSEEPLQEVRARLAAALAFAARRLWRRPGLELQDQVVLDLVTEALARIGHSLQPVAPLCVARALERAPMRVQGALGLLEKVARRGPLAGGPRLPGSRSAAHLLPAGAVRVAGVPPPPPWPEEEACNTADQDVKYLEEAYHSADLDVQCQEEADHSADPCVQHREKAYHSADLGVQPSEEAFSSGHLGVQHQEGGRGSGDLDVQIQEGANVLRDLDEYQDEMGMLEDHFSLLLCSVCWCDIGDAASCSHCDAHHWQRSFCVCGALDGVPFWCCAYR